MALPPAFARLRFPAPTPMPSRAPTPAPLLPRQSALLLGFVAASAADKRFVEPTPAPITARSSLPSSRFRVTVIPRQKDGEARAEAAPLQRTRASLCEWHGGVPVRCWRVRFAVEIGLCAIVVCGGTGGSVPTPAVSVGMVMTTGSEKQRYTERRSLPWGGQAEGNVRPEEAKTGLLQQYLR